MTSTLIKIKLALIVIIALLEANTLMGQVSMGFENLSTTQSETAVSFQYVDGGNQFQSHDLVNDLSGGRNIPVNSSSSGTTLGFSSSFRPTRTGGSNTGLTDGDIFGYATGNAASAVGDSPIEGNNVFFMEDTDGEVTVTFDPVNLNGVSSPMFSMYYIVDGGFENSNGANDRLYIRLDVTNCSAATSISLLDTDGGGSGGGGGQDMNNSTSDEAWVQLTQNLTPYVGCLVQLVVELDLDSNSEEMAMDNIIFTAGTTTLLPIELISFEATANEKNINLTWSTATEVNNSGFSIERSTDGNNFNNIAWIEGAGDSYSKIEYAFEDNDVRSNKNYYYRLKQLDSDGAFEYSPTIISKIKKDHNTSIGKFYPNPSNNGRSTVNVTVPQEMDYIVNIMSTQGQILATKIQSLATGDNQLEVDLSQFAHGNYIIGIESKNQKIYRKLIR